MTQEILKKRVSKVTGKVVKDYVDNKLFTQAINYYNKIYYAAIDNGEPKPKMPDYIGECIIKIVNGIASRWNFKNYTYRDEMILDGQIAAIYAVTKFNGEKYDNAYGYLTLVIWRAMTQRIKVEKEQQEIIENLLGDPSYSFYEEDDNHNDDNVDMSRENLVDFYYEGKI